MTWENSISYFLLSFVGGENSVKMKFVGTTTFLQDGFQKLVRALCWNFKWIGFLNICQLGYEPCKNRDKNSVFCSGKCFLEEKF